MNIPEIPNINHIRENDTHVEKVRPKTAISMAQHDNVTIGDESLLMGRLLMHLKRIQAERIEANLDLKLKIQIGEYDPSSEEIAKAILYGSPILN